MIHDIFSNNNKNNSKPTNSNSNSSIRVGGRHSSSWGMEGATNSNKPLIQIDHREKNSLVPAELINQNFSIEFKQLKVADYIVKETAIERKTTTDLIQSMINKRLFKQLQEIKQYPKYLLIIENDSTNSSTGRMGNTFLLEGRKEKIHPNAIKGFILSITLSYKVPIIFTNSPKETATYISLIAKKQKKETRLNPTKKQLTPNEQLEFTLQSFPNIGAKKSKQLLEKFKNLKTIFNSSENQLQKILNKKSKEFLKIINQNYRL